MSLALICSVPPVQAEEKAAGEFHRHHFGGLLAGSHNTEKNGFTAGGDYEFRFARPVGLLTTYEHVGGGFREDLVAVTAAFHPWKGLKVQAGPGWERDKEVHEGGAHDAEPVTHVHRRALLRFGAGYDVEVGEHFTLGPDFAFDFLHGEKVFVYGVTFGFGFGRK